MKSNNDNIFFGSFFYRNHFHKHVLDVTREHFFGCEIIDFSYIDIMLTALFISAVLPDVYSVFT
jgi:hypothetical protein